MRILEVENLLNEWFRACLRGGKIPYLLMDYYFSVEDGKSPVDYWESEKRNFESFADVFDLDSNLYAKIKSWFPLEDINKSSVLVYVYNAQRKFAFKLNMTISYRHEKYLISSNNSPVQIVPKHIIQNGSPIAVGLAITAPKTECEGDWVLTSVYCNGFNQYAASLTEEFDEERFYSIQMHPEEEFDHHKDNILELRIQFRNPLSKFKVISVNRKIIVDGFQNDLKPYTISDGQLKTLDSSYPVALFTIDKEDKNNLIAYPRKEVIDLNNFKSIIVTDAQDNDWYIDLE